MEGPEVFKNPLDFERYPDYVCPTLSTRLAESGEAETPQTRLPGSFPNEKLKKNYL